MVFPDRCSNCNWSGQAQGNHKNNGAWHHCYKLRKDVKYSDSCHLYMRKQYIPPGVFTKNKEKTEVSPQQAVATIPQNKPKNKPRQLTSKKDVVLEAIQKADGLTKEELQKITGLTFGQVSYALLLLRESWGIVGQHLKNHQKKYYRNEKHK